MASKSTEANLQDEQEEFEYVFEILQKQLLAASVHFYIWEQLWPTEEVVDIINRYKGFFQPTWVAHLDRLVISVTNILSHEPKAPSFYRILNMISRNPDLAPEIDVSKLKRNLKKHRPAIEAITDFRNKRVAHWDTSIEKLDKPPLFGATKRMLEALKATYNEISRAHSQRRLEFRYSQQGDTVSLLEVLKQKLAEDRQVIEYWENRVKLENEGKLL
jgi:hypothetical protein